MKDFSELFADEYSTQQDQWEKALKLELKLEDVSAKIMKKHLDLGTWPTLSLKADSSHQLKGQAAWKKASQTYLKLQASSLQSTLLEDLEGGVRTFFFSTDLCTPEDWKLITQTLSGFSKKEELEIYLLGEKTLPSPSDLKVVQGTSFIEARSVHEGGGHNVHELAVLTLKLIENLDQAPTHLGVFLDSHFFKNIAKVRALKLLSQKVLKETNSTQAHSIVALNSYREWTLFERYSNMLRNNVQVASGYIAGADAIQSSGYQAIFELETDHRDPTHEERSLRMSRNTTHILAMESMLGIVEDAAYGSYHLETLTNRYAEEAWKLMQTWLVLSPGERKATLESELKKIQETRLQRVETRKDVLTGMNDYPDGKEHLGVTLKASKLFRVSRPFEELRLKVEAMNHKPTVQIILHGDYGSLNTRINFIKNYFELIGLEVMDPLHPEKPKGEKIIVLCAKDEDYPEFAKTHAADVARARFVAGKVEVPGYEAIHAGQNIFEVLKTLVQKLGA